MKICSLAISLISFMRQYKKLNLNRLNLAFTPALLIFLITACNSNPSKKSVLAPQVDGKWWQLTNTYPDISPYKYTEGDNKVCDFTIFQAQDSTWQLIACVRGNTYPGSNRFLYRWEAKNLTDTLWKEKGVFLSTGTKNEPDGWGTTLDTLLYKQEGLIQAPYCVTDNHKYFLFYNDKGSYCMSGNNGKEWEHLKNDSGSYKFFDMGRDQMIFDDRESSGKWIAYYTHGGNYPQYMAARTCSTLTGIWSEEKMVYDGFSNTRNPIYRNEFAESPFVIKKDKTYYLFAQLHVFVSFDPLNFKSNEKVANLESSVYEERAWAPEIIKNSKGQLYIAAYRVNGIWMAKLKFSDL